MPGRTDAMIPRPDHGEHSYKGSGRLEGMKAVITGADSGIGRAVALAYAPEGVSCWPNPGRATRLGLQLP